MVGQSTERVFIQKQLSGPKCFFKKGVMRNFAEFTRKHLYQNPFVVFSCEFREICKNTFLQNSTRRLLLIIAISIVGKGVLANETLNYEARTEAYVLI